MSSYVFMNTDKNREKKRDANRDDDRTVTKTAGWIKERTEIG